MTLLFFNYEGDLRFVAKKIFSSLGINQIFEGHSQNVLEGTYYSSSIFGLEIKLELNSYDYEDEYAYMISVRKDLVKETNVDDKVLDLTSETVKRLLYINLSIKIAEEKNNKLEMYFYKTG